MTAAQIGNADERDSLQCIGLEELGIQTRQDAGNVRDFAGAIYDNCSEGED